tara:strand:+ start:12432 stop:13256 length:825 start_codon:yes stop_codon:yes gene_type:complete
MSLSRLDIEEQAIAAITVSNAGNYELARRMLGLSISQFDNPLRPLRTIPLYFNRHVVHFNLDRYDAALNDLEIILERTENFPRPMAGNDSEVIMWRFKATEAKMEIVYNCFNGREREAMDVAEEAISLGKELFDIDRDPKFLVTPQYTVAFVMFNFFKDYEDSIGRFTRAIGDIEEAIIEGRVGRMEGGHARLDGYRTRGLVHFNAGNLDLACKDFMELGPHKGLILLGKSFESKCNYEKAKESYNRALAYSRSSEEQHAALLKLKCLEKKLSS